MVTTVQIEDRTLLLLKKLKAILEASSYDEAIAKVTTQTLRPKISMAGSLRGYFKGYTTKKLVKELQNERRKEWNRL